MQSAATVDDLIEINITDSSIKWRYTCPYDHRTFQPTNGGIWCRFCDLDDDIEQAHHDTVKDQRDGVLIDFKRVRLVDGDGQWV